MSLPSEGVNANALTETTAIPTGKKLIFLDPDTNEGGIITLENLTKQILSNLVTQTFDLDQGTKTLLTALNELNSKAKWANLAKQYDGENIYNDIFNDALSATPVGSECTFVVNVKSVESNCIVKFYKRNSSSGKMIVFRFNGITIVDGSPSALLTYSVNGTSIK